MNLVLIDLQQAREKVIGGMLGLNASSEQYDYHRNETQREFRPAPPTEQCMASCP